MPLHFRLTKRLGPLRLDISRRGISPSLHVGPVGYSPRGRRWSVRLPGPFRYVFSRRR
ncbi:DUF4236 domain-containing protein [Geodermatophilus sp. URMC 61]|uniref:DUF4236 domain-containing protein n=1 Tax=Geodermatophilus sp. URMC 61 TaxID=3423411 RepID=UPI00406CF8E5